MAVLIASATGNFTASGTWKVADATSELDSEAGSTASTTAYVASSNFTPGAITVDAIAVKVASRTAGATGTVSIELYNSTGAASVATAVIDAADMPLTGGWVVLPITPVLLLAATNYQIRFKTSVTGTVTLYRNATAGNWSRQLRTTTNQAPASGDKLIIAGEHTGSGTGNNFTVTMDETASTIYGNVSFTQSITVNKRGTLSYGTTASTNYLLKLAGIFKVWSDGTFNIGTTGTPIPSTSTAKLEFSVATNVDSGLEVGSGGTFNSQGVTLHTVERALLNANAAVSDTVLTTDVTVGWKSGDQIAIAPTTRTITQGELRTLSVDSSGTTVTVSSGLTYAHDGVAPVQAEVINLNRNVKICGTSASLCAYVLMATTSVNDCDFTEFYYLGSATANKHGVEVQTTTGSASFNSCAFHTYFSTAATAIGVYSASTTLNNLSVVDCNFWNTNYSAVYLTAANTTYNASLTFTGNWCINGATGTTYGFLIAPVEATVSNNRIAGYGVGLQIINAAGGKLGTHSGNVIHSCTAGVTYQTVFDGTISNTTIWRTGGQAFNIGGCSRVVVDGVTTFGNATGGITMANNQDCVIKNFVSNSQAGYTQPYGIYLTGLNPRTVLYNCSFGATTGHTTADIVTTSVSNEIIFHKCTFASATELSISTWRLGGGYYSQDHQNIAGSCKRVAWEGTSTRDTVIFNNASPSLRMAPAQTVVKLRSPYFRVAVASGNTSSPSVWVRKSVVGDGTAYNGAEPRLVVRANPAAGILSDTVLDTAAGAAGSWEQLTGTTAAVSENTVLDFFVDCDGTQGWVNVDDFEVVGDLSSDLSIFSDGAPFVAGSGPASSFTDVPTDKVELSYAYKYNSTSNNRTGTRRQPVVGDVKTGVLYGPSDSLTGTYDGSDRWTDPGENNTRLGVAYKANSVTNNKTGNVRVPSTAQVQAGVVFDSLDSLTGTFGEGNPPTFAGISSLTANPDGSLTASWSAASDVSPPIVYKVYIQANTATGLFATTPFATYSTSLKMFTIPSGANLVSGTTYYVGVRATDAYNNTDSNSVSMSAASSGVEEGVLIYDAHAAFSINNANELQISMWLTANGQPVLTSLGTASYTVYDKDDVAVGGMTESGIAANGNGVFVSTPISANTLDSFTHYRVEVTIVHQSQPYIASRGLTIFE